VFGRRSKKKIPPTLKAQPVNAGAFLQQFTGLKVQHGSGRIIAATDILSPNSEKAQLVSSERQAENQHVQADCCEAGAEFTPLSVQHL